LISETISSGEDDTCFQPALNTDLLTVQHVIFRLEKDGGNNIPVIESAEIEKIKECLNSFSLLTEKSSENKKLKDL